MTSNISKPFFNPSMNTPLSHHLQIIFLMLSFASSFLELGSVIFLISRGYPINSVLLIGLCYQIGNLAAGLVKLSRGAVISALVLTTGLTIFLPTSEGATFVSILLISLAVQKMRRYVTTVNSSMAPSTFTKRAVRIAGFACAGLFSYWSLVIAEMLILAIVVYLACVLKESWFENPPIYRPRATMLSIVMVMHQCHYFSYAYLMPILFIRYATVPTIWGGVVFIIGWISYILSERLFHRFPLKQTFIFGHLVVSLSLMTISLFYNSSLILAAAWFVSGLGGGTVFAITEMNRHAESRVDLSFWEDIGHVGGVLITFLSVCINNMIVIADLFILSAVIAFSTAIAMSSFVKLTTTPSAQVHPVIK